MTDSMVITAKQRNLSEKDYLEIKSNEVLNFLQRYSKLQYEKGKRKTRQLFPSFNMIGQNCKITYEETKQIIDFLEQKGDIVRDVSQRYLKWVWDKLESKKQQLTEIKKEKMNPVPIQEKPVPIKKEKKPVDVNNVFSTIKMILFKLLIIFPVIVGVYTSYDFTKIFFTSFYSEFQSLCVSIFIVFSSLVSFQIFSIMKNWKKWVFFVLWFFIISFSITSGIYGQLTLENNKQIAYEESNVNDRSKIGLFNHYDSKINDIKIDIESVRKERQSLLNSLDKIDYIENRKQYDNVNWMIYTKDKKLNVLKIELKTSEDEKEKLLKENVKLNITEKKDFFVWLESMFGVSADIFRFVLYSFLAIFADVVPPLFFSVVLFYKEKE